MDANALAVALTTRLQADMRAKYPPKNDDPKIQAAVDDYYATMSNAFAAVLVPYLQNNAVVNVPTTAPDGTVTTVALKVT